METKNTWKNKKIELSLITFGATLVIGMPIIIVSSLYAEESRKIPSNQIKLTNFYNEQEGRLFDQSNFYISTPKKTNDKYLVEGVAIDNVIFSERSELINFKYNIEIVEVLPDSLNSTLKFKYKIYSIIDPSVEIIKESNSSYSVFRNNVGENELFSK